MSTKVTSLPVVLALNALENRVENLNKAMSLSLEAWRGLNSRQATAHRDTIELIDQLLARLNELEDRLNEL